MSVYVSASVYLVGPVDKMNSVWNEYLKAQEQVVQNAIELGKQNGSNFVPSVDKVNDDVFIYNGSFGVIASRTLVEDLAVIRVYTSGDIYGEGFKDGDHSETNPILLKLNPEIWKSGDIKRADWTHFGDGFTAISDENEVFFKQCKFAKLFSCSVGNDIAYNWPPFVLDDQGLEYLARGTDDFYLTTEEYDDLLRHLKTCTNRDQLTLDSLEETIKTELYKNFFRRYKETGKIIDSFISRKQEQDCTYFAYAEASFDNEEALGIDYDEFLKANVSVIVKGAEEDLEKFKVAVFPDRHSGSRFALDSIVRIYRNKPDFKKFLQEHWGCTQEVRIAKAYRISEGLEYTFYIYLNDEATFPRPIAEELSKKFPHLTIDIQAIKRISHQNKDTRTLSYEIITQKSHGENGIVTYETISTFCDELDKDPQIHPSENARDITYDTKEYPSVYVYNEDDNEDFPL